MPEKTDYKKKLVARDLKKRSLVLHNDDIHTFQYVINALMKICNHDELQAEQCALIVHFRGKCPVKGGPFVQLKPMKDQLILKKLRVTID